jgi:hypothetical protein
MNNNQNNEVKIVKHYSFIAFAQLHGMPELFDSMVNKETGEQFSLLRYNEDPAGEDLTVFFGKSVKNYKYEDIMNNVDKLFVGEADNDKYYMYTRNTGKRIDLSALLESIEV